MFGNLHNLPHKRLSLFSIGAYFMQILHEKKGVVSFTIVLKPRSHDNESLSPHFGVMEGYCVVNKFNITSIRNEMKHLRFI